MKEYFEHLGERPRTSNEFFENALKQQQKRVDWLLAGIKLELIAPDCSDYIDARDKLFRMQEEWRLYYANKQATA